jgi:hypothetical protein
MAKTPVGKRWGCDGVDAIEYFEIDKLALMYLITYIR